MTTDEPTICGRETCDRPADGWFICQPCTNQLTETLCDTAWMLDQLDLVLSGTVRYADTAGKVAAGSDIPLPYNPHASMIRERYVRAIITTYRQVTPQPVGLSPKPLFAAAWLASHPSHIRLHPDGGQLADEILKSWKSCEHTVDRPPGKKYLGICATDWEGAACGGHIYQINGKPEARCDTCGGEYDNADELRASMLNELDNHLFTAAEIVGLSAWMGLSIGRKQVAQAIYDAVRRKQLIPAQSDPHRQYRFIEARALLERAEKKRRENLQ